MRRLIRLVCGEDAAELVEFAISSSIFFILLFGIVEFCLVIYASNFIAYAAQKGTRYAMVRGSDWTDTCASASSYACQASEADVKSYVSGLPHPGITLSSVEVTWPHTTGVACTSHAQGCQVQVRVHSTYSLNIPFIPAASIPLTSTSIETIQN